MLKEETILNKNINLEKDKKIKCGQCEKNLAFTVNTYNLLEFYFLKLTAYNNYMKIHRDVLNVAKTIVQIVLLIFI